MNLADFVMVCICDYSGQVRGKGFPARALEERLQSGVGWAPTCMMITAFGDILDTPWGPRGEVILLPDRDTAVAIDQGPDRPPERFLLCDIVELDSSPWACCPRSWLKAGLTALEQEFGLKMLAAFEHEFHYTGAPERLGDAYLLDSIRMTGTFPNAVLQALEDNGLEPESFLPEYGAQQFELTCKPALSVVAADRAVQIREITRAIARAYGHKATFSPVMAAGLVGNGVHIHFSLQDSAGRPINYDPAAPHQVGPQAAQFVAGILRDMPALVALTAPSVVSYERMRPHRWSATLNNLGDKDREAGVRLAPLTAFPSSNPATAANFEYRAADAAASPYLALGAVVWAGLQGLRDALLMPEPTTGDPEALSPAERQARKLVRLPQSLEEALAALAGNPHVKDCMGEPLLEAYLMHKRSELKSLEGLTQEEQIDRYVRAY